MELILRAELVSPVLLSVRHVLTLILVFRVALAIIISMKLKNVVKLTSVLLIPILTIQHILAILVHLSAWDVQVLQVTVVLIVTTQKATIKLAENV